MACNQQLSDNITKNTVEFVQQQIALKNTSNPYSVNTNLVYNTITDIDVFPYTRFYRGVSEYSSPIVFDREAGFRPVHNHSYVPIVEKPEQPKPNVCFQPPCTTIFPCLADSDYNKTRNRRNDLLNKQIQHNISI